MVTPVADLFKPLAPGVFEQANPMARVLKFVNIGPDFRLPGYLVSGGFATSGAAGVKSANGAQGGSRRSRQFDENTPYFLNVLVGVDDVLVA